MKNFIFNIKNKIGLFFILSISIILFIIDFKILSLFGLIFFLKYAIVDFYNLNKSKDLSLNILSKKEESFSLRVFFYMVFSIIFLLFITTSVFIKLYEKYFI